MKDATTGKPLKPELKTDWAALAAMSEADIHAAINDDTDAFATDEAFWQTASVVYPKTKQSVTMRLDADLLDWFRQQKGYQTRINAILRVYMQAHQKDGQV